MEVSFNLEALLGSHSPPQPRHPENPALVLLNSPHLTPIGPDPLIRRPSGNSWGKCWGQEENQRWPFASFQGSLAQACLAGFVINGGPSSTLCLHLSESQWRENR